MKKLALISAMALCMTTFFSCGYNNNDNSSKKSEDKTVSGKDDNGGGEVTGKKFENGTVEGNVYTNNFSDLKITLTDDWTVRSTEELQAALNLGSSITGYKGPDRDDIVNMYDFQASNENTGESIIVGFEDISSVALMPEKFTIDDYIELSKSNAALTLTGVDIKWSDTEKITLGGSEYTLLSSTCEYTDYDFSMNIEYAFRKIDNYFMTISYTSGVSDGSIEDYSDFFSKASKE